MATFEHQRMLVKTAKLYYEQELTQSEISTRLRLSRQKVQRLLHEAREQGIVRINIRPVMGAHADLEKALEQGFGLREAIIVETAAYDEQSLVAREIGAGAADYLLRVLQPGDEVVISWGSSLLGMVEALQASGPPAGINGVKVVQGLGGLGDPIDETHATELTRRLAKALGGQAVLLPAPGVAGTDAAGKAFRNDPFVVRALEQGAAANLAFMGIGAPRPDSILCRQSTIVSWSEISELQKQGAVGDINLRYYDDRGYPVASELDSRVIGLSLAELLKIERVVGVAGGSAKFEAIRAALRRKLVDVLVTDHITAQRLLEDV
ncbi:MAG: sugar-binding transcriptional regulator [Candidatus Promineifilaceae bacterium]